MRVCVCVRVRVRVRGCARVRVRVRVRGRLSASFLGPWEVPAPIPRQRPHTKIVKKHSVFEGLTLKIVKNTCVFNDFVGEATRGHLKNTQNATYVLRKRPLPKGTETTKKPQRSTKAPWRANATETSIL